MGSHEFIRAFDLFLKLNGKVVIAALGPFVNLAILPVRGGNGLPPLFFFYIVKVPMSLLTKNQADMSINVTRTRLIGY